MPSGGWDGLVSSCVVAWVLTRSKSFSFPVSSHPPRLAGISYNLLRTLCFVTGGGEGLSVPGGSKKRMNKAGMVLSLMAPWLTFEARG